MIEGSCHCGSVRWHLAKMPVSATACSCTACRRYGAFWAYGYEGEDISLAGETTAYIRGNSLSFNFCPECGCLAYWRGLTANDEGRRRVAVNLRMTEPGSIADIPVKHFDGLDRWELLPPDDRCIRQMWF